MLTRGNVLVKKCCDPIQPCYYVLLDQPLANRLIDRIDAVRRVMTRPPTRLLAF